MTKQGRKARKLKKKVVKVKRPIQKWVKKTKAKKWITIHAPKIFNEEAIGETILLVSEPEKIVGRTVVLKLSTILNDMSKSHISIKFRINQVKGDDAYTEILKYELSRVILSRMTMRRASKVESIDDIVTQDGKRIRIKSLAITLRKATNFQRTSVRNKLSKLIKKTAVGYNFEAFVLGVVSEKIQNDITKKLKKVYPLRKVDIRMIEILQERKTVTETKPAEEVPKVEETKKDEKEEKPKEEGSQILNSTNTS